MESKPSITDLREESQQLRACRTGFILFGGWIFVRLFALIASLDQPGLDKPESFTEAMAQQDWLQALLLITMAWPAFWQLRHSSRSSRWLKSWRFAHGALLVAISSRIYLALRWNRLELGPGEPVPLAPQILEGTVAMLDWFVFWWLGVLLAEFAMACRSQNLVERTEHFGYWVLANVGVTLAYLAWMLPRPWEPGDLDGVAGVLALIVVFLEFVTLVILLRLVTLAGSIARFLANECELLIVQRQLLTEESSTKQGEQEDKKPQNGENAASQ